MARHSERRGRNEVRAVIITAFIVPTPAGTMCGFAARWGLAAGLGRIGHVPGSKDLGSEPQ